MSIITALKEPFILLAPSQRIGDEWAKRHMRGMQYRPIVCSTGDHFENCVRGQRGRIIIVIPSFVGSLEPFAYTLDKNILIDLRNIDPRSGLQLE